MKQTIQTAPVVVFPDFEKPFLLETDASKEGWEHCSLRNRGMDDIILWLSAADL